MLINEQTDEQQRAEILLILQEECAEVVQAVAKCNRFGFESKHPFVENSPTNIEHLTEELGDLQAMINLCVESGIVDPWKLDRARAAKGMKLAKWSSIFHKIN